MSSSKIRVGIVGLQPNGGWAAFAHVPALRKLSNDFEICGVANSSLQSAQDGAQAHNVPLAFASAAEMAASPGIDLVVITTRVPQHYQVAKDAILAGKHVYCEWPLGRTLEEAVELTSLADARGILAAVGTQSRVSPAIRKVMELVRGGLIGQVISTSVTGYVSTWGPEISDVRRDGYLREARNGASLLTIPLGHTLAALSEVLGDFVDLSAVLDTQYKNVRIAHTDEHMAADAADHIIIAGHMDGGIPLAVNFMGGNAPTPEGFVWVIRGAEGDLRISGPDGYIQVAKLNISHKHHNVDQPVDMPYEQDSFEDLGPVAGNVARIYELIARDIRNGTTTAPTFANAVCLHQVASDIEKSAALGCRVNVNASFTPLR